MVKGLPLGRTYRLNPTTFLSMPTARMRNPIYGDASLQSLTTFLRKSAAQGIFSESSVEARMSIRYSSSIRGVFSIPETLD